MTDTVAVDTMIASAWLGARQSERHAKWVPVLGAVGWVPPFPVVAEMRFGAEVAGWGPRRRGVLERLIRGTAVIPPLEPVIDAYVELRTWAARNGHGIAAKDHEADRWVAAVALAGALPLATEDTIFDGLPFLQRIQPT